MKPPAPVVTSRQVKCPACGGQSLYATSNPYRPFCSERCKNIDLGAWASESFRVEVQSPLDDADLSQLTASNALDRILPH